MNKGMDLMIDLETLGRRAGCVVWEIAAVAFNPATGEEIADGEWLIDVPSAVEAGLEIEEETARWWQDRGGVRRTGAVELDRAAREFVEFVVDLAPERIWSRGAAFDFPILEAMLAEAGQRVPWSYWQACCQRTVFKVAFGEARRKRDGEHYAVADCRAQIADLVEALGTLGKGVAA